MEMDAKTDAMLRMWAHPVYFRPNRCDKWSFLILWNIHSLFSYTFLNIQNSAQIPNFRTKRLKSDARRFLYMADNLVWDLTLSRAKHTLETWRYFWRRFPFEKNSGGWTLCVYEIESIAHHNFGCQLNPVNRCENEKKRDQLKWKIQR